MKYIEKDNKFIAVNEKNEEVGFIQFNKYDDFNYTAMQVFVDIKARGQKVAKGLVDQLAIRARKDNMKIIPLCSYVKKLFENDPDYQDIKEEMPAGC
ncbi:N-acetyltransferase [Acholeplasma sp. OttesenSCG-928-E16]|nr:N-acetyltransferase [Acholeplasma sp. OttesenSCG-928-E16]